MKNFNPFLFCTISAILGFYFLYLLNNYYIDLSEYFNGYHINNAQKIEIGKEKSKNNKTHTSTRYNFTMLTPEEVEAYMDNISSYNTSTERERHLFKFAELNLSKKYLITAVSNNGFLELVLNWAASLLLNNYTKFLIVCLDQELYENMIRYGLAQHAVMVPAWLPFIPDKNDVGKKGGQPYNLVTETKVIVVQKLLEHGITVLLSDVDIVWLSPNVLRYIDYVAPNKNLIFSTDIGGRNTGDGVNSGFYVVRSSNLAKKVFEKIREEVKSGEPDQIIVNRVFSEFDFLSRKNSYALDPLLFPHGLTYMRKKMNQHLNITPMIFHACWLGGIEAKKQKLRELRMWYL